MLLDVPRRFISLVLHVSFTYYLLKPTTVLPNVLFTPMKCKVDNLDREVVTAGVLLDDNVADFNISGDAGEGRQELQEDL